MLLMEVLEENLFPASSGAWRHPLACSCITPVCPRHHIIFSVCGQMPPCFPCYQPGRWPHLKIFNIMTSAMTLFPSKVTCMGSSWASQMALAVKNPPANAAGLRDVDSTPGSGRSPGGGHDNPLQYSCLENPMNRETWRATVHGFTESGMTEVT